MICSTIGISRTNDAKNDNNGSKLVNSSFSQSLRTAFLTTASLAPALRIGTNGNKLAKINFLKD
jgi:hypothetical protein